ncbi:MAG: type II toxin-antitoxin system HicB family antitoxin [Nitrosotalea sp.]
MEIEGKIFKSGKFWLIEIPSLDAMTQGKNREDALAMAEDLITEMMFSYFEDELGKDFEVNVIDYKKDVIGITTSETKLLQALCLRRQREKSGSTIKQAAQRLGSKSPNAYAQYERGTISVTLDKYEDLLQAANPFEQRKLRLV